MSAKKPRTRSPKKVKMAESGKPEVKRPPGRIPFASVLSRRKRGMVQRLGRGFSRSELQEAGLLASLARRWGASVDDNRRSSLESNVNSLKAWYAPQKAAPAEKASPASEGPAKKKVRRKRP